MKQSTIEKEDQQSKNKLPSLFSNLRYIYGQLYEYSHSSLFFALLNIPIILLNNHMNIYLPALVVSLVTDKVSQVRLILTLALASFVLYLSQLATIFINNRQQNSYLIFRQYLQRKVHKKFCHTSYSNAESQTYRNQINKAKELYHHWDKDVCTLMFTSTYFLVCLFGILTYSTAIAVLHPLILLVLFVNIVINYYSGKKRLEWERTHQDQWYPIDAKKQYIESRCSDFKYNKEIRLYSLEHWFGPLYHDLKNQRLHWEHKKTSLVFLCDVLNCIMIFVRDSISYWILIYMVLNGKITAADFLLYLGIIGTLSDYMNDIIYNSQILSTTSLFIQDYRNVLNYPDDRNTAKPAANEQTLSHLPYSMSLSHVSFTYPKADKPAIDDISLTIQPGEKIAVVGRNGAGKTTLIKLICGLYHADQGSFQINQTDAKQLSASDYFKLFSVVFQDMSLIPGTIAENVAMCEQSSINHELVQSCLKQAGLWSKVQTLPNGTETTLQKALYPDAIELSGGETQKLLLARAIYKNAPILVLDEPTSALDPIAENELYQKYASLTRNKTSIYISHRLSSTRFCDRILYLQDGKIIEEGSHEELMARKGEYFSLFETQSYYYKNTQIQPEFNQPEENQFILTQDSQ